MTVGTDAEAAPRPPLALELLVHGVGGTTPERMLDDPRTVCLAGDDTAGVHRRACDADAEEHPEQHREAPVPEAYCWSNLTSGNGSRALWLLLLPFMVANLAHWMRPPSHRRTLSRGYGAAVRLLALTLTVLLVAAACEVALDLVGWQCAGSPRCVRGSSWLGFAAAGSGGWWSEPGRRLALAALVPAALTALLWWLSHRTWSAYESQRPAPGAAAGPGTPSLALPGFWYGRRSVARLRAAHTAAGLLTVAAAVTVPALRHDHGGASVPLRALGWALAGLICCLALAAVAVTCRAARSEAGLDDATDHRSSRALLAASAAALAAAACYAAWHRPAWTATGRLPTAQAFIVLTVLQGALIAALALLAALLYRSPPPESVPAQADTDTGAGQGDPGEPPRPVALSGLAGPAVGLLACGLGGVLTGGGAQRAADWLDRGRTPGEAGSPLAGPPAVLTWEASVIPLVLALLAVAGAAVAWRLHGRERALCGEVEAAYPDEQHRPARTRQIAAAVARARLTDSAPLLVAVVCAAAFVLGAAAVTGALTGGGTPGDRAADAPAAVSAAARAAQALGSWLVGAGVVALVALGRRAYRDPAARRTVGILWDVGTFWPRAAHPFAPPCYAERAVPDLSWRMESWTARTGGRIILSGHSQGSVLSAAAVWQLDPATRGRVALLTYGCPLTRLYGRWFPAYFGQQPLDGLHHDMHAWRNLWRRTDPIGGPVGIRGTAGEGGVDRGPLLDPAAYGRSVSHPLPEPVRGHSDFQADPAFARERAALLARLLPAGGKALPAQGISGRSSG
ncbi:hypothetical protein JT723_26020 [Streptomyces bryophytorum]|uniref:hypothetical protein n=1 Tax=Actinacidiphila bryophytorum TaxID=1436133 RepID=UPI00195F78D0|nr:hypothetical protein [Actinacidiphila bryophytorum]MBM9439292.1 hypothetical protein [Actinacidiphila bryophytorum]